MDGIVSIEGSLKNYMSYVDNQINSEYKFIDSKEKDTTGGERDFDSNRLIYSLTTIGIPLTYSIRILNIVVDKIVASHPKHELETFELRRIISDTLYALHSNEDLQVDPKRSQTWGDLYLRKYGNPEGPIQIIHRDGKIEDLTFKLLRNSVIPEVFSDILKIEKSQVYKRFIGMERDRMSKEIMDVIKEMGLFRIHHRTLLLLTRDLAMQPPHPWVVSIDNIFEYIDYNIAKVNKHFAEMSYYYDERNISFCRSSIYETLHHISAAILGYYNEIPGCGILAPFHNLCNLLDKLDKYYKLLHDQQANTDSDRIEMIDNKIKKIKGQLNQFGDSKLWIFEQDLNYCGTTFEKFLINIKQIKHNLEFIYQPDTIDALIPLVEYYVNVGSGLVRGRSRLKEELELAIANEGKLKGKMFEDVVAKIFSLPPEFLIKKDVKIKNKQFDIVIEHKCTYDNFKEMKKYIFVECKNTGKRTGMEVVEKLGKRIDETPSRYCNSGIIVSAHGFTRDAAKEAISWNDKGTLLVLLSVRDLNEMIKGDVIREINNKINFLFYGKVD